MLNQPMSKSNSSEWLVSPSDALNFWNTWIPYVESKIKIDWSRNCIQSVVKSCILSYCLSLSRIAWDSALLLVWPVVDSIGCKCPVQCVLSVHSRKSATSVFGSCPSPNLEGRKGVYLPHQSSNFQHTHKNKDKEKELCNFWEIVLAPSQFQSSTPKQVEKRLPSSGHQNLTNFLLRSSAANGQLRFQRVSRSLLPQSATRWRTSMVCIFGAWTTQPPWECWLVVEDNGLHYGSDRMYPAMMTKWKKNM